MTFRSDTALGNPLVIDTKQFTRSDGQPGTLYTDLIQGHGYTHVKAGSGQFKQISSDGKSSVSYESLNNMEAIVEFGKID